MTNLDHVGATLSFSGQQGLGPIRGVSVQPRGAHLGEMVGTERPNPHVVLLTGAQLFGSWTGGTAAYVRGLVRFLTTQGLSVDLISNGPVDDPPARCEVHPVSRGHIASTLGFHKALKGAALDRVLQDAAVLHLQRPDDLWFIKARTRTPPMVCTLHGDAAQAIRRRRGLLAAAYYRRIEGKTLPQFDAIVAVNQTTATAYRNRYPSLGNRIVTIPTAAHEACAVGEGPPARAQSLITILFAGRLSIEKRVDRIIGLFKGSAQLRNARLLVAGSGPQDLRLRRLARDTAVEFLGPVPHDKMPSLYRIADALIIASEFEGTPTVALEALACGCPVVGLASCGLSEDMSNCGTFIGSSIQTLPELLLAAADRKQNGTPIHLNGKYTWSAVGEQLLSLYRKVAPNTLQQADLAALS